MLNSNSNLTKTPSSGEVSYISWCATCNYIRDYISTKVNDVVPSPASELLLGTTLGIDGLKNTPRFNDLLRSSSTIHIIVVSGFNLSLILNKFLSFIKKNKSLFTYLTLQLAALIYALLTGFEPPIIRALVMVSISMWLKYYGKNVSDLRVLLISAMLILVVWPEMLYSLSFHLSFLATVGLITYAPFLEALLAPYIRLNIIYKDVITSLAAQLFVSPFLLTNFNTINLTAPLINGLILWVIPHLTILGFIGIFVIIISDYIGHIFGGLFHYLVVLFITILSKLNMMSISYEVSLVTPITAYLYYLSLITVMHIKNRY